MNKVAKSALQKGRTLSFYNDTVFAGYDIEYPIKSVIGCHYEAKGNRVASYPHLSYSIDAELELFDSRDGVPFRKKIHIDDEVDVMEQEDEDGDGFIYPGSSIDLDLLCLSLIVSSLPLRIVRSDSELPKGGKGYNVYDEDSYLKEQAKQEKSSPFDALKDIDLSDE